MTKKTLLYAPLALLALSSCAEPADVASSAADTFATDLSEGLPTRILNAEKPLTAPSQQDPEEIAVSFLLQNSGLTNADELRVDTVGISPRGITHVRLSQEVEGLRVYGAYARVALTEKGEVIHAIERLATSMGSLVHARVNEADALRVALDLHGYAGPIRARKVQGKVMHFQPVAGMYRAPWVERVAYADEDGTLLEGFLVETWSGRENQLDHTLVDGNGREIKIESRTANDSYNVFIEGPDKGPQTIVAGPGAGNTESPAGWLGTGAQTSIRISGNNVNAYLDTDANNAADAGGTSVTNGNFVTVTDLSQQPTTTANKNVAVQNLFYLNNVVHDVLYRHGFTESELNFQVNNFGKGGLGNDPVSAEAQDGSGTNNANFSTPSDGSAPRMQMYLWSGTSPTALVTVAGVSKGGYASSFGPALTTNGVNGAIAIYNDNTGTTSDACEASVGSLTGKLVIVDRGTCDFTVKVLNAQNAGAVGVIIANNVEGAASAPGGTNRKIKIPSAMVTLADGTLFKGSVGASGNLKANSATPIQLDGDLDSDIVFHEYGHGLTWRMIGSMSGAFAGALGEGASDTLAFLINQDDVIGEYSYGRAGGIRRYPYENYPLTYKDVTGTSVHNDGEIYAGAMWRLMKLYLAAGYTHEDVLSDWVDGMNYTPATPVYENMRDGMLKSAAGTDRECLIWRGFAPSGIGEGAKGSVNRLGAVTITESFTVPTKCQ